MMKVTSIVEKTMEEIVKQDAANLVGTFLNSSGTRDIIILWPQNIKLKQKETVVDKRNKK